MESLPHDLRDYALDELTAAQRAEMDRALAAAPAARVELDRLLATRQALLSVPAEEPPRRIAFVSDKVFEPSPWRRLFDQLRAGAPRLAFGTAAVLAVFFAGVWATDPTLRLTAEGFELAFGGAAPAAEAAAPATAGLTEERVRAVVDAALAENEASRREVLAAVERRAEAIEARSRQALDELRVDSETAYRLLRSDIEKLNVGLADPSFARAGR